MNISIKAALLGSAFALAGPAFADTMHPETGEKLAEDQTFTYRVLDEHTSVDPQIVEDVTGSEIVRDLFEGLYNQDKDGNLVAGVATMDYTTNDDKTVYTFKLRPEAKWSDGKPVTANDFVYSWQRLADPTTASEYQWYVEVMNLKNAGPVMAGDAPLSDLGVKALDDHTLEVTLESSLPYFAKTTTHASTFPAPKWAIEEHGVDWIKPENIVVNGAYKLTEHIPNERSVRERNEMYWDNDNTIIDKTVALVINDENVALTRYKAGELDRTEIPAGQYPSLKETNPDEDNRCSRVYARTYYYTVNVSDNAPEFLKDVRVRQSFVLCDRSRHHCTDKVLQGGQTAAYSFTPCSYCRLLGASCRSRIRHLVTGSDRNAKAD